MGELLSLFGIAFDELQYFRGFLGEFHRIRIQQANFDVLLSARCC
jgi:hypothetical protein